jgi:hypothetical protein
MDKQQRNYLVRMAVNKTAIRYTLVSGIAGSVILLIVGYLMNVNFITSLMFCVLWFILIFLYYVTIEFRKLKE